MTPIELNKEECVLVSGSFTREDILGLDDNPTLLSAKVSYLKSTIVNLYRHGYNTFILTSNGLFDVMVANIIANLNTKGLAILTVFVKPFPEVSFGPGEKFYPEEFAQLSFSFSESSEDFDAASFSEYLSRSAECVLLPSKVKARESYRIPAGQGQFIAGDRLPN